MMVAFQLPNLLGFLAGSLLLISGLPVIYEQFLQSGPTTPAERKSRLIMALGNAIWVLSGVLSANLSVIIMCGLNMLIQTTIWIRMHSE